MLYVMVAYVTVAWMRGSSPLHRAGGLASILILGGILFCLTLCLGSAAKFMRLDGSWQVFKTDLAGAK